MAVGAHPIGDVIPWAGGRPVIGLTGLSSWHGAVLSAHLIVAHRPVGVDFKHTQVVAIATRIVR